MTLLRRIFSTFFVILILGLLCSSAPRYDDFESRVLVMTGSVTFDFFTWTLQAVAVKMEQNLIGSPDYFLANSRHGMVMESLALIRRINELNVEINRIYSDPKVGDPAAAAGEARSQLAMVEQRWDDISPLVEATLEGQVSAVLAKLGLTSGGQPIPWVLYHVTPLPQNLVISRRDKIETRDNYIVNPIPVPEADSLEKKIDSSFDVSSLVVDIGGLAAYPTMVQRTDDLDWLVKTISHEWIHLYLAQRPLGQHYSGGELRTMNETTASIAGTEIGQLVMQRFYPVQTDRLLTLSAPHLAALAPLPARDGFDFRKEMHSTRVEADRLLGAGKIDEAEQYMEARRQVFWEHGYAIRKLNQAYFAFNGSYADEPGGAAGEDPVGPAVRALRAKSGSLKEFLERISAMTSFEQLKQAVNAP